MSGYDMSGYDVLGYDKKERVQKEIQPSGDLLNSLGSQNLVQ